MSIKYGSPEAHPSTVPFTNDKLSTSLTNGTGARKFVAQDKLAPGKGEQVDNSQHLLDQASALKRTAMVADRVAELGRQALESSRALVAGTDPADPSRSIDVQPDQLLLDQSVLGTQVGFDVFGEPSLDSQRFTQEIISRTHSDLAGSKKQSDIVFFNDAVPELDSILVDMDRKKGIVDCFFATLKFSLPTFKVATGKIKAFKIMRSSTLTPSYSRNLGNLSLHGVETIRSSRNSARSKNGEKSAQLEKRLSESSVQNSLTDLVPIDQSTNSRNSAETTSVSVAGTKVDASFQEDKRFVSLSLKQNPIDFSLSQVQVGRNPDGSSTLISETSENFVQVAFCSPDKLSGQVIGPVVQYTFEDPTIVFGRGYTYYVLTLDEDMTESVRSALGSVVVEALRVPPRPREVHSYIVGTRAWLTMSVEDQLVEKFEIYRKELRKIPGKSNIARVISGASGYTTNQEEVESLPSGFVYLGDSLNDSRGGSSFNDLTVVPGKRYEYRVFSVDVFGNKSESPTVSNLHYVDRGSRAVDLGRPYITAEVDSRSSKMKLTFGCLDERVIRLFLSRIDMTLHQQVFAAPGEVSVNKLGDAPAGQGSLRFQGSKITGTDRSRPWIGQFDSAASEIVFVDQTVTFDHTYQYRIEGVDRFGNKTSSEFSRPVFVGRHPMIAEPVNLKGEVVAGMSSSIAGVRLSWQDGNLSIPPEDLLGSQDKLADTLVRNLYQIERKSSGDDRWVEFPLISNKQFMDSTAQSLGNEVPSYLPPVILENQFYTYRIKAVQSGAFVSNYSTSIEVFTGMPVLTPSNVKISSCDSKLRPFYIVVNWSTPPGSGQIDRWEIERVAVNNYAASALNMADPTVFDKLKFTPFREINRESSRFRSMSSDNSVPTKTSKIFSGDHYFQDMQVSFGNTYFYRICAIGLDGRKSPWTYGGMKVTDDSFERKLDVLISQGELIELTGQNVPLTVKSNALGEQSDLESSSFVMNPSFSKPVTKAKF